MCEPHHPFAMPIPTYDRFIEPILRFLAKNPAGALARLAPSKCPSSTATISMSDMTQMALPALLAVQLLHGCSGDSRDNVGASPSTAAQAVASTTTSSSAPGAPPAGPAALGQPRSFHFVVPMTDKPTAVVVLDAADIAASASWGKPGARIDSLSPGPGRGHTAGILAAEEKLPESLRLRGVAVHLYADDTLLCDGTLATVRVGAVGEAASVVAYSDSTRDGSALLGADVPRVLLFEIDVTPDCARRFKSAPGRVAWARDASLPAPVIVGKAGSVTGAATPKAALEALRLARGRPSFVRAQQSTDNARKVAQLGPQALESAVHGTWTQFSWKGEKRGYLALVEECPPPVVGVGLDFRGRADGTLELSRDRAVSDVTKQDLVDPLIVDPLVLVDVDADGQLESIGVGTSYRLQSFEGSETYETLEIDHCI